MKRRILNTNTTAESPYDDEYIWSKAHDILVKEAGPPKRVFEIGCGNEIVRALKDIGYDIIGIDPSKCGIEHGRRNNPAFGQLFGG